VPSWLGRCARSSPACERAASRTQSGARCAGSFAFSEHRHLRRAVHRPHWTQLSRWRARGVSAHLRGRILSDLTTECNVAGRRRRGARPARGKRIWQRHLRSPAASGGRQMAGMAHDLVGRRPVVCILALIAIFLSPFRRAFR
jgi:hypothetical protein